MQSLARARLAPQSVFRCLWIAAFATLAGTCTASAQISPPPAPAVDPASISGEPLATPQLPSQLADRELDLRQQLKANPKSAATLYELALLLRERNKPKESLETYTRAAKLQTPSADQLRSVALDYVLLDDYADAIHWLETAATTDPRNPEVLYSLARCYYTRGQFHEAEQVYLRLLAISPGLLKAEENLGLTYDAENLPEKAEAALQTAATMADRQTSDEWPFLNLGAFLLDHDRAAEAIPFLQKATAIAPKSALCHEKLGRALGDSGKAPEGVNELEAAVQLDPKNPGMRFELGHAYREAGQLDKARAEFAASEQLRKARDKN